jgi:hypothetical protein
MSELKGIACAVTLSSLVAACGGFSISSYTDLGPTYEEVPSGLHGAYYLPRTVLNITVAVSTPTSGSPQTSFTITKSVEADPTAKLFYMFEPSATSDDTFDVVTGESGLLSSVSSNTYDRSGDIAVKVAQLIFTTATAGAPLPASSAMVLSVPATPLANTPFGASYDPFDTEEATKVRNKLLTIAKMGSTSPPSPAIQDYCILVGGEVRAYTPEQACVENHAPNPHRTFPVVEYDARYPGIYYRRPAPMPIRIFTRNCTKQDPSLKCTVKDDWSRLWMGNDMLFDKSDIYQVRIDRTAFIQRQTKIAFTNGTLTEISLTKPSEALAAASYPVTIAKLVASIPLAGLQQDTSVTKAQGDLIAAQTNLINLQRAAIKGNVITLQQAP